ncbi:hypothetical protein CLOM_g20190, partial [Closterium sp. NIES-68]
LPFSRVNGNLAEPLGNLLGHFACYARYCKKSLGGFAYFTGLQSLRNKTSLRTRKVTLSSRGLLRLRIRGKLCLLALTKLSPFRKRA